MTFKTFDFMGQFITNLSQQSQEKARKYINDIIQVFKNKSTIVSANKFKKIPERNFQNTNSKAGKKITSKVEQYFNIDHFQ